MITAITHYSCEDEQVGGDEKVDKVERETVTSRHRYNLRAVNKNIVYDENSSTHDVTAGIENNDENKDDNNDEMKDKEESTNVLTNNKYDDNDEMEDKEESTNVPTDNKNQKHVDMWTGKKTVSYKATKYKPSFYVGMTSSALTYV